MLLGEPNYRYFTAMLTKQCLDLVLFESWPALQQRQYGRLQLSATHSVREGAWHFTSRSRWKRAGNSNKIALCLLCEFIGFSVLTASIVYRFSLKRVVLIVNSFQGEPNYSGLYDILISTPDLVLHGSCGVLKSLEKS